MEVERQGVFSVKSTYSVMCDGGTRGVYAKSLWSLRIPIKVQIFVWLVLKGRLPTTDFVVNRGWTGCTTCVLCGCENETVDHLFVRCVFSHFVLGIGDGDIWLENDAATVRGVWERGSTATEPGARVKMLTVLSASWAVIWSVRNSSIFRLAPSDPLGAVGRVRRPPVVGRSEVRGVRPLGSVPSRPRWLLLFLSFPVVCLALDVWFRPFVSIFYFSFSSVCLFFLGPLETSLSHFC